MRLFQRSKITKAAPRKRRRTIDPGTRMLMRQVLIGVTLCILVGTLITGVWHATRATALTIDEVVVSGGETISHEQLRQLAWQELSGTYLKLIPRQFSWLYPHDAIASAIASVDRVESVTVDKVDATTVTVTVTEYTPTALWCSEDDSAHCLFVNEAGFAFAPAPQLTGGSLMRYVTLGREPERFTFVQELTELSAIEWFVSSLESEVGWSVQQVEMDSVGDVFYIVSGGGELKATVVEDPAVVLSHLATILTSPEFVGLKPGEFQYIDLRFGNKVFVNRESLYVAATTSPDTVAAADPLAAAVAALVEEEPIVPTGDDAAPVLMMTAVSADEEEVDAAEEAVEPEEAATSSAPSSSEEVAGEDE